MGAARMLSRWTGQLRRMMPDVHGHQIKSLAVMSLSLCWAGACQIPRLALHSPTSAKPASTRRRFERFLANQRLPVLHMVHHLAEHILRSWAGRRLDLFIDETALGPWLRCLKVSAAYRGRSLPLAWICFEPDRPPESQPEMVEQLLVFVASCLSPKTRVVLMADRGLSWPRLIDLARELGWEYLLRVQGQTCVRLHGVRRQRIDRLAPRRGRSWCGAAEVFKGAGWRRSNVVACWERDRAEPWLLVTSLRPCPKRCREYRRRMWQEQSFRDEKSHGFDWQKSRVRRAAHADRLLLVLLLAMWMAIGAGTDLIRRGQRHLVDTGSRPTLSIFQLGHRYMEISCPIHAPPLLKLALTTEEAEKCVG